MLISGVIAAAAVLGQTGTIPAKLYRMKEGDTLARIARLNGTGYERLVEANPGLNPTKIRPGVVIKIPARPAKKAASAAQPASGATYKVRNGDNDWSIAARLGTTSAQLRKLNPGVNWKTLQVGQVLRAPGSASPSSRPAPAKAVATAKASVPLPAGRTVTVARGDNDWAIAARLGIKPSELRKLNPGVNWSKLKPGQKLAAPGAARVATSAPSSPVITTKRVAIARENVRVRTGGRTTAPVRTVASKGQVGSVLDRLGSWYKISLGQEVGWVRGDMLRPVKASTVVERAPARVASAPSGLTGRRVIIAKNDVNVRSGGATSARVLAQADRGEGAKVLAVQGAWLKVKLASGGQGWIRSDMASVAGSSRVSSSRVAAAPARPVRTASAAPARRQPAIRRDAPAQVVASLAPASRGLLATAASAMGTRYRWGGTSRSGFDCSGFVSYVYRNHGVRLPRTSIEQSRTGQSVGRGDLKQGDLVFFKTRGNRVSHVGIYIGGGKFIHASSGRGRVRTDSLNSGYYSRRYAGAKRVKDVPQGQVVAFAQSSASSSRGSSSRRSSSSSSSASRRPAVLPSPQDAVREAARPSNLPTHEQKRVAQEDKKAMEEAMSQLRSEPRSDRIQPGTAVTGG